MKGALSIGFGIVVILAVIGYGGMKLFDGLADMMELPEYATKDAVYAQYGSLIKEVETAIEESQSFYGLAAQLEKIEMPAELVYLTLIKQDENRFDDEKIEIVKKFDFTSFQQTIHGTTGYGKLNDVPVIVINLPVNRHSIKDSYIYLKHDHPSPIEDE